MSTARGINERLKQWRFSRGLSQRQAAAHLGVPKRTLQEWEQGRRSPRGLAWAALLSKLEAKLEAKARLDRAAG
jgi:DNA-binding transcriptional regulator YiaG